MLARKYTLMTFAAAFSAVTLYGCSNTADGVAKDSANAADATAKGVQAAGDAAAKTAVEAKDAVAKGATEVKEGAIAAGDAAAKTAANAGDAVAKTAAEAGKAATHDVHNATQALATTPSVKAAILRDPDLSKTETEKIDVDTKDGVVHLKGTVSSEANKKKAESIATQTLKDGNKSEKVSNELTVTKS